VSRLWLSSVEVEGYRATVAGHGAADHGPPFRIELVWDDSASSAWYRVLDGMGEEVLRSPYEEVCQELAVNRVSLPRLLGTLDASNKRIRSMRETAVQGFVGGAPGFNAWTLTTSWGGVGYRSLAFTWTITSRLRSASVSVRGNTATLRWAPPQRPKLTWAKRRSDALRVLLGASR